MGSPAWASVAVEGFHVSFVLLTLTAKSPLAVVTQVGYMVALVVVSSAIVTSAAVLEPLAAALAGPLIVTVIAAPRCSS